MKTRRPFIALIGQATRKIGTRFLRCAARKSYWLPIVITDASKTIDWGEKILLG